MRKIRILVLPFVVLAAIVLTATIAGAGNGATTTPFKYTDEVGFSCSGAHIVKTAPHALHKESETCIAPVDALPPGTYSLGPGVWWSDYHYFVLHESTLVFATSATVVVADNGDGTATWEAVSYYP